MEWPRCGAYKCDKPVAFRLVMRGYYDDGSDWDVPFCDGHGRRFHERWLKWGSDQQRRSELIPVSGSSSSVATSPTT